MFQGSSRQRESICVGLKLTVWLAALSGEESSWSVDGELLHNNHISAKVYRGLIDVFARGIEHRTK